VLLITCHYPPQPAIGAFCPGAGQISSEQGWEVLVLAPQMPGRKRPGTRVSETAIDWLKRLKRWLAHPDFTKGWILSASEAVADLARQERVGAILTTSPPESCHIMGA
jgi:hypothetical protein